MHITETTVPIQTKFCRMTKTTKCSRVAYNESKKDGRHLENRIIAISLQRFDRSARNLARWRILTFRTVLSGKFWTS